MGRSLLRGNQIVSSEWIRYRRSWFFYIYIGTLIGLPVLLKWLKMDEIDETLLLIVITLTVTVLSATEIPRLLESGIMRSVLLSNITRKYFYLSQLLKYLLIYFLSFVVGMVPLQVAFINSISWGWIGKRFFIYLIIIIFYILLSQLLSIILRRTVESLMSSLLIIFVIIPIFNSLFQTNTFYKKLPFLYLEPKNFLLLETNQILYVTVLLRGCSAILQYMGIRNMERLEV